MTNISRRGVLGGLASILAAGVAPAAIGSGVLMPVRRLIFKPLPVPCVGLSPYDPTGRVLHGRLLARSSSVWEWQGPEERCVDNGVDRIAPGGNPADVFASVAAAWGLKVDDPALAWMRQLCAAPVEL